jgi:hypothetical protein
LENSNSRIFKWSFSSRVSTSFPTFTEIKNEDPVLPRILVNQALPHSRYAPVAPDEDRVAQHIAILAKQTLILKFKLPADCIMSHPPVVKNFIELNAESSRRILNTSQRPVKMPLENYRINA